MKIKAVLFDFDGVFADTEEGIFSYMEKAFLKYDIVLTENEKRSYIGTDGRILTEQILKKHGINMSVDDFLEEKRKIGNYYEDSLDIAPMPGLKEFLNFLKENKLKIGLVSSTSSKLILVALNRMDLTGKLDVIICGDMVKHKKPNPQGYNKAMEYLKVFPEECVIFEDSPTGIRAGKASGAYVIGFRGGEIQQDTSEADEEWSDYYVYRERGCLFE